MSTSHNKRKAVRDHMAATGEKYTEALRAVDAGRPGVRDDATPPEGWATTVARYRNIPDAVIAVMRDLHGDGRVDQVVALDLSGNRLSEALVPHIPAEPLSETYLQRYHHSRVSPAYQRVERQASLGWPERLAHRLGFRAADWDNWPEWSDGSVRVVGWREDFTHSVTATQVDDEHVRMVVIEHPNTTVLDITVQGSTASPNGTATNGIELYKKLDPHGFVIEHNSWTTRPNRDHYATARRGHLAERGWWTLANVRVLRDMTIASAEGEPRKFEKGEIVQVSQIGGAGKEVRRDRWSTSLDAEYSKSLPAKHVEVVEVLEHHPETWDAAALDVATVTALLEPHHENAAAAAESWAAAGLHVAHEHHRLAIRTPAPEYRFVGYIESEFRKRHHFSEPYEALTDPNRERGLRKTTRLDALPLDPVAAVAQHAKTN